MYMRLLMATLLLLATGMIPESVSAQEAPKIRQLAPGVLTAIPSASQDAETFSGPLPLIEVVTGIPDLDWTPNYSPKSNTLQEMAKQVVLRRPIWELEIAFKPLRMIEVDVPQSTGKMQRKLIWYMVYRVSNRGQAIDVKRTRDTFGHVVATTEAGVFDSTRYNQIRFDAPGPKRFFPHFVLESREYQKSYLDRVIPAAQKAIQEREDPGAKIYNSVEITRIEIPLSDERIERGVWGVVTWEDVDPRIDFLSIYIRGLTNAFESVDPPGAYRVGQPPGSGRIYTYKTLQLNFWCPGDSVYEHEREIRYGIPVDTVRAVVVPDEKEVEFYGKKYTPVKVGDHYEVQLDILDAYGLTERLDHLWIYR